jgi:hypothetical protein
VPFVNAPGTTIEVSMPHRASSPAYETASESIAAFAAKYGERYGGVPPRALDDEIHTTSPRPCLRSCGSAARFTRCVLSTLTS